MAARWRCWRTGACRASDAPRAVMLNVVPRHVRQQLDLPRELGLKECESTALTNLGSVCSEMGEHARARECFLED